MTMSDQSINGIAVVDTKDFYAKVEEILERKLKKFEDKWQNRPSVFKVDGLNEKPLFTTNEVCEIFHISRQTLHVWVKDGKLQKRKVNKKGRVYFLNEDVQALYRTMANNVR